MVPTRTSPPPKVFEDRPLLPLPPLRIPQSVGQPPFRSFTIGQPTSSQFSLPHSEPPTSPPPPQTRRFNTVEPVYSHSTSRAPSSSSSERPPQPRRFDTIEPAPKAPPPSRSEGAWECREGECILIEDQVERCLSRSFRSQDADQDLDQDADQDADQDGDQDADQDAENMGQCDFRIFELEKDGYCLPTRRIAIRSCENEVKCISYCEAPLNIDVHLICSLHLSRDATGQRTCRNRR